MLRLQRCLIPTDREWFVNERGVASLSHPITIRRRYRGFTSLWPRRDNKVSTPLLRTRQNGLCSGPVFRISSLTAPLASSCETHSLPIVNKNGSIIDPFLTSRSNFYPRSRIKGNAKRRSIDRSLTDWNREGSAIDFAWIESYLERELDKGGEESLSGGGSFTGGREGDSSPGRGLEDFASSPPWRIAIGGC